MARLLLLSLLLAARALPAVEGAAYLKAAGHPRSAALARATSALDAEPDALAVNPAGLYGFAYPTLSFTHGMLPGSLSSDQLGIIVPVGIDQAWGLNYQRRGANDTYRDADGNENGEFEVSSQVVSAGWAYSYGLASLGLSGKWIQEQVEAQTGSGWAADMGANVALARGHLRLAAALQHLGQAPRLGGGEDPVGLPMTLRLGGMLAGFTRDSDIRLMGEYRRRLESGADGAGLGMEYQERMGRIGLALRGGWDWEPDALTGPCLGAGLVIGQASFDYAWQPLAELGNGHRAGLSWRFGGGVDDEAGSAGIPEPGGVGSPDLSRTAQALPAGLSLTADGGDLDKALGDWRVAQGLSRYTPTPTPMPTYAVPTATPIPTPQVSPTPVPESAGLLGSLLDFFTFGGQKKPEAAPATAPQRGPGRGLLGALADLFTFGSNPAPTPVPTPQPGAQAGPTPEPVITGPTMLP